MMKSMDRWSRYWVYGIMMIFGGLLAYNISYQWLTGAYVPGWINLDEEFNIPTYLSVAVFLSTLIPLKHAVRRWWDKGRRAMVAVYGFFGFVMLFIAMDELFRFHDHYIQDFLHRFCDTSGICPFGAMWVWLYLPVAVIVACGIFIVFQKHHMHARDNSMLIFVALLFLLVFVSEIVESRFYPYMNYTQEFIEILGALALYGHFALEAGKNNP